MRRLSKLRYSTNTNNNRLRNVQNTDHQRINMYIRQLNVENKLTQLNTRLLKLKRVNQTLKSSINPTRDRLLVAKARNRFRNKRSYPIMYNRAKYITNARLQQNRIERQEIRRRQLYHQHLRNPRLRMNGLFAKTKTVYLTRMGSLLHRPIRRGFVASCNYCGQ